MRAGWLRLLAQTALGAALIALLLWQTDIEQAYTLAKDGSYLYLLIAFPLYVLGGYLNARRWRLALHGEDGPSVRDLFGIYLVALMLNRVMPVRLGDIFRVQLPSRRYRLSGEALTAIVFVVETLLDGGAFVILFLWSLAFLGVPSVHVTIAWTLSVITVGGLVAAGLAARLELKEGWQERGLFRRMPEALRARAGTMVPRFLEGLRVLRDLKVAGQALALTLGNWAVQSLIYYLFARTFGVEMSLAQAIVVTITAAMIVSLPLVPSSLGTYEVAITGVLVLMGVPNAEAVTYSLGSHILGIAFSVAAGMAAVPAAGIGLHDVPFFGRPVAANGRVRT